MTYKDVEEEEIKKYQECLEKMADWARKNPGTAGEPASLLDGGPGDSDCISTFLASIFHAAGQKVRFVLAGGADVGDHGVYVEVFHLKYGKNGQWIAVLPFAPFIFEGPKILAWERILEHEL
jgi:hypothetical protein